MIRLIRVIQLILPKVKPQGGHEPNPWGTCKPLIERFDPMIDADYEKTLQSHYSRLSNRPSSHLEREYAAELLTDVTLNGAELAPHEITWLRFFDAAYPPKTAILKVDIDWAILQPA